MKTEWQTAKHTRQESDELSCEHGWQRVGRAGRSADKDLRYNIQRDKQEKTGDTRQREETS